MAHAPTAAVTAKGIRDGDRAALGALVARRGAAVLAYCDRVAAPGRALEAAGEAFARFRREVVAAAAPRTAAPNADERHAPPRPQPAGAAVNGNGRALGAGATEAGGTRPAGAEAPGRRPGEPATAAGRSGALPVAAPPHPAGRSGAPP